MSGKKLMNPKKIYLAAGGAAGGSHWWEPQPVRRENGASDGGAADGGAADGGAADSGEYFLVDFGKKLGLQSKKTILTKMVCWRGWLTWIQKSILANSLKMGLVWVFFSKQILLRP